MKKLQYVPLGFFLKTLICILLFLLCLSVFLYGVVWTTVLIICLPRYIWTDIGIVQYKSYIILLIPTLLWGLWWAIYVIKHQNKIVLNKTKAIHLPEENHKEIYQKISLITRAFNIPMPKIYQVDDTGVNSLMISDKEGESALIFSSRLIANNNIKDIINMATFHLSEVKSHSNMYHTYIIALTSCFSLWFELIVSRFFKTKELPFHLEVLRPFLYPIRFVLLPLIAILSIFALYDRLIAPILSFFLSTNNAFKQDKKALMLLQTPSSYIETLYKVQDNPRVSAFENGATFISCFQDPTDHLTFLKLIDTHPNIENRIQKIKKEFKVYFIYEKEEK
ncbi:MAG: M48 family metalloprotease [Alphaproteobacteria bacterium]|nr:M48 family metalloprotease [Alphaproteobacteria bacterium]